MKAEDNKMEKTYSFAAPTIRAKEPVVFWAEKAPFRIHGVCPEKENGLFARIPKSVAEQTSERVALLYTNTAGVRLRFATDSSFVAIAALYPAMTFSSLLCAAQSGTSAFCFDLYVDGEHRSVLCPEDFIRQTGSVVSFDLGDGRYEALAPFGTKRMRQITLCFPAFVNVSDVFVGLEKGATVEAATPYVNDRPVVFYGSSITQGACASRAGNSYPNVLSRKFHFDYINLGFAGACTAEMPMIDYLCRLPMHLLVYDYDHNTPSVEHLRATHLRGLRKLREAHPDIPIVLLSKPNRHNGKEEALARMQVIRESYEALRRESNAPVHFVDGQRIFESHDPSMMTIDGTHPTDLGFFCMAEALSEVFQLYF